MIFFIYECEHMGTLWNSERTAMLDYFDPASSPVAWDLVFVRKIRRQSEGHTIAIFSESKAIGHESFHNYPVHMGGNLVLNIKSKLRNSSTLCLRGHVVIWPHIICKMILTALSIWTKMNEIIEKFIWRRILFYKLIYVCYSLEFQEIRSVWNSNTIHLQFIAMPHF